MEEIKQYACTTKALFESLPHKPLFLCICGTILVKTLQGKGEIACNKILKSWGLDTNFSFAITNFVICQISLQKTAFSLVDVYM